MKPQVSDVHMNANENEERQKDILVIEYIRLALVALGGAPESSRMADIRRELSMSNDEIVAAARPLMLKAAMEMEEWDGESRQ